jgi:hypothetical protein
MDLFKGKKVVQNEGVKYSKLLEQFMAPFYKEFEDMEYLEDMFQFAVDAWNFGNLKMIMPKDEFDNINNFMEDYEVKKALMFSMIDYKVQHFKDYINFIADFELEETDGDPILTVVTQREEAFLANMLDNMRDELEEELLDEMLDDMSSADFEENYIDRYAIVIKPKQAFFDWYNAIHLEAKIDSSDYGGSNIYLVDENKDDLDAWLKKKFDKFFKMELEDWHSNKKQWPQRRNYKMFNDWFQVETSRSIMDLEKRPVSKA